MRSPLPDELLGRPFLGSQAVRTGLLTPGQLRGPAWRRLYRDVYVDARVPVDHRLRGRAAGLVLPPGAALGGRSAACAEGLPLGDDRAAVLVLVPRGVRFSRRGCEVRQVFLPRTHVREGVPGTLPPVTVPQRTAWDIASEPDLVEAVAALDVLFHHHYLQPRHLDAWIAAAPDAPAAKALALADGRAESRPESRVRVRLILAGLPQPVPQYEVWLGRTFAGRVDLAWPAAKVALEYDGAHHAEYGQFTRDRARLNRLVEAGWTVLHMTARDLREKILFAQIVHQLRVALASGGMADSI
ncbi:endonuclease domain-containing protein [Cryptosporangium phraense]|uniref:DUF559 domain-containing protein n=1 Tax=Cryptosporangium phraense TaxID=2593070 RepID=A0A545AGZ4_9ACTN|nr:hypothetical protein [Cryptosporangium phraense]TQS40596.1 hypothetical protein FL583_34180 [Cryptosporangium phraense]